MESPACVRNQIASMSFSNCPGLEAWESLVLEKRVETGRLGRRVRRQLRTASPSEEGQVWTARVEREVFENRFVLYVGTVSNCVAYFNNRLTLTMILSDEWAQTGKSPLFVCAWMPTTNWKYLGRKERNREIISKQHKWRCCRRIKWKAPARAW